MSARARLAAAVERWNLRNLLVPTFRYERQKFQHHLDGGEQSRTVGVTWLYRGVDVTYSSPWRKR